MPKESYDVRILRAKAVASLRTGVVAFNGLDDDARITRVLLHLQHAFEMLLKSALLTSGDKTVFDKKKRMAIGMEASIKRCIQNSSIKLTNEEAGTIRVLDNLRDGEQHWHQIVEEGMLYLHARAAVTLFDDLLHRVWKITLADHVPVRVLPLSAEPPQELDLLVDQEYERIAQLLKPGRRATAEAKGRIRALLAMEALSDPDAVEISESDVNRVVRGVREDKERAQVFPKLSRVSSMSSGEGLSVEVRFVKTGGLPVTYTNDPDEDAAAIREVDLERKFYMGPRDLPGKIGLKVNESLALRRHLGLDNNDDHYSHIFQFGSQSHIRYSDNALNLMKKSKQEVDLKKIWEAHKTIPYNQNRKPPKCDQPGCVINA